MESEVSVTTDWVWDRMKAGEPLFFIELRHPGDVDLTLNKVRGALRMTTDEAKRRFAALPMDRTIVVCSAAPTDEPAVELVRLLVRERFRACALEGGLKAYLAAGLPVEETGQGREMAKLRGY